MRLIFEAAKLALLEVVGTTANKPQHASGMRVADPIMIRKRKYKCIGDRVDQVARGRKRSKSSNLLTVLCSVVLPAILAVTFVIGIGDRKDTFSGDTAVRKLVRDR